VFDDNGGKPVLTFTEYACETDGDGNVVDHIFLDVEYTITIVMKVLDRRKLNLWS
jgi:hypothetical protein